MEEKKCTKCECIKSIDNYYRLGGIRKGFTTECKECYKFRKRNPVNTKTKRKRKTITEEYLTEIDNIYSGLKIKCKLCQEYHPSYRYQWNNKSFYRKCNKCMNKTFRIPKILHEHKWVINFEELKRREDIYIGIKSDNDIDQKHKNLIDAERVLKLVSRRRGLLEVEELFDLINTSLNIYDRTEANDIHDEFVNMYNNILHYYKGYKQKNNEE